jgi:hypothetical protein
MRAKHMRDTSSSKPLFTACEPGDKRQIATSLHRFVVDCLDAMQPPHTLALIITSLYYLYWLYVICFCLHKNEPQTGALLQLEKGQLNCGVELCTMLVDAYSVDAVEATAQAVQRVLDLMAALPTEPVGEDEDPPIEAAQKIANATLKWLRKVKGTSFAPSIHAALADYVTRCLEWMGLGLAMPHYVRSMELSSFAAAVASAAAHAAPDEEDMFIARAVLSILEAGGSRASGEESPLARALGFSEKYATVSGRSSPDTPLVHFLALFLEAFQKRSYELASLLLREYDVALSRDESLKALALACRDKYVPPPASAGAFPGGLFGGLLRGMMAPASTS